MRSEESLDAPSTATASTLVRDRWPSEICPGDRLTDSGGEQDTRPFIGGSGGVVGDDVTNGIIADGGGGGAPGCRAWNAGLKKYSPGMGACGERNSGKCHAGHETMPPPAAVVGVGVALGEHELTTGTPAPHVGTAAASVKRSDVKLFDTNSVSWSIAR